MGIFQKIGNLFSKQSSRESVVKITDAAKPISKIPQLKTSVLNYGKLRAGNGRGQFVAPEYNLTEIGVLEDVESMVRQTFKKRLGLMFKEGHSLIGPNQQTVKYCKTRFAQIARATNIPHSDLLRRVCTSLVRVSNAYLIKVRKSEASGGRVRIDARTKKVLEPVAGYFPVAPETMHVKIDSLGRPSGWKQVLPDGQFKLYSLDDVIHFHIDRREGFLFGVPSVVPVMDDIRALRQIEENVELLLYQHLFPLFHWRVGDQTHPAGLTEGGERELDIVEFKLAQMPAEGGIVTDHRHEIIAIGSEGRAIRAEGYLDHFQKRVFAGLGVSSVDLGYAETANRATSQVLSRAMIDSVKGIQDAFEDQFNNQIITELLLESTFDENTILDEENFVRLEFKEIDLQSKHEAEEHAIKLFEANGLAHSEFRNRLGLEPMEIPEDPEDQDMTKYPLWSLTNWKLFKEPEFIIKSIDESYTALAKAYTQSRSTALTAKTQVEAEKTNQERLKAEAEEDRKTKLAVAKQSARKTRDEFLVNEFNILKEDLAVRVATGIKQDDLKLLLNLWSEDIIKKLSNYALHDFVFGFEDTSGVSSASISFLLSPHKNEIIDRISFFVKKLTNELDFRLSAQIDSVSDDDTVVNNIKNVFESLKFRVRFIRDTETSKAYNLGKSLGFVYQGHQKLQDRVSPNTTCEKCLSRANLIISVDELKIDDVAPHHPGCQCRPEPFEGDR